MDLIRNQISHKNLGKILVGTWEICPDLTVCRVPVHHAGNDSLILLILVFHLCRIYYSNNFCNKMMHLMKFKITINSLKYLNDFHQVFQFLIFCIELLKLMYPHIHLE